MLCLVEMLGRVLPDRVVTAANMAAGKTEPQVHPAHTGGQTFLTALRCAWGDVTNLREVRALIGHRFTMTGVIALSFIVGTSATFERDRS